MESHSIRCGKSFNKQWRVFERNHLGALGRAKLCDHCRERYDCSWPFQYGEALKGSQVVFATQTHLEQSPFFVPRLKQATARERVLVLLDEVNFMMKPYRQHISAIRLTHFIAVLEQMSTQHAPKVTEKWLRYCKLLQMARTEDLRVPDWKAHGFSSTWAYRVQSSGWQQLGERFVFLGYALQEFDLSLQESREKEPDGSFVFSVMPCVNEHFIIYSGTSHQALSEYRLGKALGPIHSQSTDLNTPRPGGTTSLRSLLPVSISYAKPARFSISSLSLQPCDSMPESGSCGSLKSAS